MEKVKDLVWEPSVSRYGADDGLPELREALVEKVHTSELTNFPVKGLWPDLLSFILNMLNGAFTYVVMSYPVS